MAKISSSEASQIQTLLKGAFGEYDPARTLDDIFAQAKAFGRFEWMLTILAIEIDLRVDIPERLAQNLKLSAAEFVSRVAKLPKVESQTYTLDSLALLSQALLSLDLDAEGEPKAAASKTLSKSGRKGKKKPAAKPARKPAAKPARKPAAKPARKPARKA